MAVKKQTAVLEIPALQTPIVTVRIVGDSSLITHPFGHKVMLSMLQKQQKKASSGREIRRPAVEFADSLYWRTEKPNLEGLTDEEAQKILSEVIPKSKFGFPSIAFKAAALNGGLQQGVLVSKAGGADLAKTTVRGAVHILGEFVEIEGTPIPREDPVKIQGKTSDLRYRAEFVTWSTILKIKYNAKAISIEQIINLLNIGGFAVGVGEWRPEKTGTHGMFHVEGYET